MGASCVDVFCGAGGLSLGFENAGWKVVGAIDHWPDAIKTHSANLPSHTAHCADVTSLTAARLARLLPSKPDWVIGGPPCQGFSTVGKRNRSDPRNALVREFARFVKILRPEGFLIENVLGLRDMDFVRSIESHFRGLGYAVSHFVLSAADFGVPQLRRRLFFVGSIHGLVASAPLPTVRRDQYVSVWDAIGDLPPLSPGESAFSYASGPLCAYQRGIRRGSRSLQGHEASRHPAHLVKAISFVPDGGNRQSIPARYQPRSGFHNSYSRLHSASPAVAVTQNMGKPSGTRCIHPFQHRGLTTREGARLQSFPDRFRFAGAMMSQRLQVANAVPPLLAEAVAAHLLDASSWNSQDRACAGRTGNSPAS